MENTLRSCYLKTVSILALLLLVLMTTDSKAQTINLFSSGFEPTDPNFTYDLTTGISLGISQLQPRTGVNHGRAVGGTGTSNRINASIITPLLTFEPGYTYSINIYARVDATNAPVDMTVYRTSTPSNAGVQAGIPVLNTVSVNTTTYQLYSASFTVATTTNQHLGIHLLRNANGGAINIDDVLITRICIPSTSNAGSNISTCTTSAGLGANTPAPWETGTWSVVSGTGTFSNANNPNATVSNLSIGPNVFQWTVTNASCTPATSTVTVTRQTAPAISNQPTSQTLCVGDNASFSVTATGSNLTYQWRLNGVNLSNTGNITGATSSTLNITNLTTGNAGTYSVVITGSCTPSVTSTNAVLTVNSGPAISTQPSSQTVCTGETFNLNVAATAGGSITYQWRRNGTPLVNGGNISGANSATLVVSNAATGSAGTYDVVVSSQGCNSTSNGALITVNQSPEVTGNPSGQMVCEGTNVNFSVTAIGANLTYQWRRNGTNLTNGGNVSGANSATLTLNNVSGSDIGNYDVIVSNPQCPSDTSSSAGLIVQFEPVIQVDPLDEVGCDGGAVSLNVIATGSGVTYQWRKNGINLTTGPNISNVNSATLLIDPFSASDTGSYDVIISGTCGTPMISDAATLSLGTPVTPSVSISASDNPVCDSITVFFTASPVNGGFFPSYQWYVNNVSQGINNDTLALLGLQTGDEIFVEMVSSADCPVPAMVTSNTITMTVTPLDSTCIPVVSILPQYCPFTQNNIMDIIEVEQVYDANAYQYRIENTTLGFFATPIRSITNTAYPYVFGMNMVNGLKFNTTYDVSVRVRIGGVWGSYGPTCQITTPPFPQISLLPSSCNITIPTLNTLLFSEILYNVSNYRYQITGPNGFSAIYLRGSGSNAFSLAWVPGIQYGTTYDVRVEAFVNGDWGGYGPICQVTTPAQIPTTQLSSGSCNITLTNMQQILSADPVPNASNYRYRITRPGYTAIYTRNSSSNLFSLGWINSIQFNETYNVEVAAMVGGVWASYGPVCTVTTPTVLPTTQLASGSCNVTLANLSDLLFSDPVGNAQDYQYRVINTTLGYNQVYQRGSGSNAFSMSWLQGIAYNTTYTVEVRVNIAGNWGSYGPVCNVTTPANIPTTQLSAQWCGATLTSISQIISSDIVPNATNYQYHVFNGSGFNATINRGSGSNLFSLGWIPGIQMSETYSVEVRAMVGGVWANFGPVCNVTTPSTPARLQFVPEEVIITGNELDVTIYPNPATIDFTVQFKSEENSRYNISLFDISGRLVLEQSFTGSVGMNRQTLNIESLRKGIYVVDISNENHRAQKRLVVN